MTDLGWLAGPSALLAAVATVVGAVTLILFFSKGGSWGLVNDVSSIVLLVTSTWFLTWVGLDFISGDMYAG